MKKTDVVIERVLSVTSIIAIIVFDVFLIAGICSFVKDIFMVSNEPGKDVYYELYVNAQDQIVTLKSEIDRCDEKIDLLSEEIDILKDEIRTLASNNTSEDKIKSSETNFIELRNVSTNMFCTMDYRKITNILSDQYKIQQHCVNNEYGIRMFGEFYTVALGSYFSRNLGDTYHVILENGHEFDIMIGDFKDDGTKNYYGHPCINYDGEYCVNVIEFIIDDRAIPRSVMNSGTFSVLEEFGGLNGNGGNIKSMEYTGQVDLNDILT